MKRYISPLAETVKLSHEDVIATSYTTQEGEQLVGVNSDWLRNRAQ